MKIIVTSDFHGAKEVMAPLNSLIDNEKPDIVVFCGAIVKGYARGNEWLSSKKLGKKPGEIKKQDFLDNRLGGLLERYADEKCKSFSKGEIFTFDEGYLLKYKGRVTRGLKEAEIV